MKWRILHILESIDSGGVERRRLSMTKLLDKEKFEIKIVCSKASSKVADEIINNDVEIFEVGQLKSPFNLSVHIKVLKIVNKFKPHIIHGAVFEGVTLAATAGFFLRVPIVIIEETSEPTTRSWRANMLMTLFGKVADIAIGVSNASKDYLIKKAKISEEKVKLVVNGVKLDRNTEDLSPEEFKKELGIEENELIVGSVGRMVDSVKKFSILIEAIYKLRKRGLEVKLVLVGDGPDFFTLKKLTSELGMEDKVIFAGYQENPDKYYAIFDVFSLVSEREAFGLVLVEAMLHRLPVVATNVGGIPSIVVNNETGYLVDRSDLEGIVKMTSKLLLNLGLREKMGEYGYKRAVKLFGEDRYVREIENLYESLIEQKALK